MAVHQCCFTHKDKTKDKSTRDSRNAENEAFVSSSCDVLHKEEGNAPLFSFLDSTEDFLTRH